MQERRWIALALTIVLAPGRCPGAQTGAGPVPQDAAAVAAVGARASRRWSRDPGTARTKSSPLSRPGSARVPWFRSGLGFSRAAASTRQPVHSRSLRVDRSADTKQATWSTPGRALVGMRPTPDPIANWRTRAAQNLRAATLLAARHPPLLLPAVSRIYYACFQATCAALLAKGIPCGEAHGDAWRAANHVRLGLGARLHRLYYWRRAADYATRDIPDDDARDLVATYARLTRELGISEEA